MNLIKWRKESRLGVESIRFVKVAIWGPPGGGGPPGFREGSVNKQIIPQLYKHHKYVHVVMVRRHP